MPNAELLNEVRSIAELSQEEQETYSGGKKGVGRYKVQRPRHSLMTRLNNQYRKKNDLSVLSGKRIRVFNDVRNTFGLSRNQMTNVERAREILANPLEYGLFSSTLVSALQ